MSDPKILVTESNDTDLMNTSVEYPLNGYSLDTADELDAQQREPETFQVISDTFELTPSDSIPHDDVATEACLHSSPDAPSNSHVEPDTVHLQTQFSEISQLVELPHAIPIPRQRFFWEIFSGPHSPLTQCVLNLQIPCLQPFDILLDSNFDIYSLLIFFWTVTLTF